MDALINQCADHSVGPATQLFGFLIQTLLAAQCSISPPDMWPNDFGPNAIENGLDEYDFIVVGAGSAGSVMASRLSENPAWKVLLLEAGGDPPIESEVPALIFGLQKTDFDWGYYTEPSKTGSLGMEHGVYWPRGKLLGGSSAINAMIYIRGNRRDYDGWAAAGNEGWDYDTVLKYFIKSEANGQVGDVVDAKYHGVDGELNVNYFEDIMPIRQIMQQGIAEMGLPWNADVNGENPLGFTNTQVTAVKGARVSSAKAFLQPAKNRENLHVIKNAHVTKLHFSDEAGKRVDGVEFLIDGQDDVVTVRTRKEVILSAGALNSPQILLLSGIGPAENLSDHDIPVLHDLAVGQNLQDHLMIPYVMQFHKSIAQSSNPRDLVNEYYKYAVNRTGYLATIGLTDFVGFVNTLEDGPYPDIQYHSMFMKKKQADWHRVLQIYGYNEDLQTSMRQANDEAEIVMWLPTLLNPRSAGRVELRSSHPFDPPKLTHNYFAEQADVDTVVRSIRLLQRFEKTAAFRENEGAWFRPALPTCDQLEFDSDAYWQCYVRHMSTTLYHPTSTTKMGPLKAEGAVVDNELRVHGVKGLRVVDVSIMPDIVSGNTNAPAIMIAERAADFVKEMYGAVEEEM